LQQSAKRRAWIQTNVQARGSNESDEPYESYAYESDVFVSYESYEPYVNLMHVNLMSGRRLHCLWSGSSRCGACGAQSAG